MIPSELVSESILLLLTHMYILGAPPDADLDDEGAAAASAMFRWRCLMVPVLCRENPRAFGGFLVGPYVRRDSCC